jgi:hypothetical protein
MAVERQGPQRQDVGLVKGTPRARRAAVRGRPWKEGLGQTFGRVEADWRDCCIQPKSAIREANTTFVHSKVRTLAYSSSSICTLAACTWYSSSVWATCNVSVSMPTRRTRYNYDQGTYVGEYVGLVGDHLCCPEYGPEPGEVGEYRGEVGEYCGLPAGLVGEYVGLVGLNVGDVGEAGERLSLVGLNCGLVGLYWGDVGLNRGDVGL